jgi:hypothetical protein
MPHRPCCIIAVTVSKAALFIIVFVTNRKIRNTSVFTPNGRCIDSCVPQFHRRRVEAG